MSSSSPTRRHPDTGRWSPTGSTSRCWSTSARGSTRSLPRRVHRRSSDPAFRFRQPGPDGTSAWERDAAIDAMYPRLSRGTAEELAEGPPSDGATGGRLPDAAAIPMSPPPWSTPARTSSSSPAGSDSWRGSCSASNRSRSAADTFRWQRTRRASPKFSRAWRVSTAAGSGPPRAERGGLLALSPAAAAAAGAGCPSPGRRSRRPCRRRHGGWRRWPGPCAGRSPPGGPRSRSAAPRWGRR